jgi:hypothetical protein
MALFFSPELKSALKRALDDSNRMPFGKAKDRHRPLVNRAIKPLGVLAMLLVLQPTAALAWKPTTHGYLAKQALDDALDDGRVTISSVDYVNGRVTGTLGTYAVDPTTLQAIRNFSAQYRAGVLGPDAYPDIATGQQVIHPSDQETRISGGPDAWLSYLWSRASSSNSPAIRAFSLGYLTHAGGDMFGHTFINNFTGGAFAITPPAGPTNAIKHIVLEGYADKRVDARALDANFFNASINGVQGFIYQTLIDARPGTVLDSQLLRSGAPGTDYSVPRIYSTLRANLQRDIDAYYAKKKDYDRRAEACKPLDFSCSRVLILGEKAAYVSANAIQVTYKEAWRDDIDTGLQAWPDVSHQVALALFYNPSRSADTQKAQDILEKYATNHLLSMAGAPDFVGMSVGAINTVITAITPNFLLEPIRKMKEDLLNALLKSAIGMDKNELKKYLSSPDQYFDQVMGAGAGERTSLQAFNQKYLKISDTGYNKPSEYANPDMVPAFHNSIVISKLILLNQAEVNRLLSDLGSQARLQQPNVMLGFINTLDGDNQWVAPSSRMVFAQDCMAYRKIFMQQPGERAGCANGLSQNINVNDLRLIKVKPPLQ